MRICAGEQSQALFFFLHSETEAALQWLVSFCLRLCLPLRMHKSKHKRTCKPFAADASALLLCWLTPAVPTREPESLQRPSVTQTWIKNRLYTLHMLIVYCRVKTGLLHHSLDHVVYSLIIRPCHHRHNFPSQHHSAMLNCYVFR